MKIATFKTEYKCLKWNNKIQKFKRLIINAKKIYENENFQIK